LNKTFFNLDFFSDPFYQKITTAASEMSDLVFSHIDMDPHVFDLVFGDEIHSTVHNIPHTLASMVVYDGLNSGRVVGYVFGVVAWEKYMSDKNDLLYHWLSVSCDVVEELITNDFYFYHEGLAITLGSEWIDVSVAKFLRTKLLVYTQWSQF
jgi:hypothetical protein